jgi:hypothetical protein
MRELLRLMTPMVALCCFYLPRTSIFQLAAASQLHDIAGLHYPSMHLKSCLPAIHHPHNHKNFVLFGSVTPQLKKTGLYGKLIRPLMLHALTLLLLSHAVARPLRPPPAFYLPGPSNRTTFIR